LFIVDAVLSALDNMGFVTNMVSLVLYFIGVMHFDLSSSANTLTNFMGSTFLLSLVGAFISDTYLNRFTTCLVFGSLEVIVSIYLLIIIIFQTLQIPNPNAMFQLHKIKKEKKTFGLERLNSLMSLTESR
jgi:hypothetical protein